MKSFLNITFIFLSLSMFNIKHAESADIIVGTPELPLELNLLISFVQYGRPELINEHLALVTQIDAYARAMTKEDIFLIGKVEVYKALLKNYSTPDKSPLNGDSITTLDAGIARNYDNFIRWFLTAIRKDVVDLINNPTYKEYLLQRANSISSDKVEYRKLAKKAELLQYWIKKVNPSAEDFPASLSNALFPNLQEALKNISQSFALIAKESSHQAIPAPVANPKDLKFFKLIPRKKPVIKSAPLNESKSVEEILAPITENPPVDLPKPTDENWLMEENNPPALQNLPKPTNDADWLQDF